MKNEQFTSVGIEAVLRRASAEFSHRSLTFYSLISMPYIIYRDNPPLTPLSHCARWDKGVRCVCLGKENATGWAAMPGRCAHRRFFLGYRGSLTCEGRHHARIA